MLNTKLAGLLLIISVTALLYHPGHAQEQTAISEEWQFEIAPYLWLPELDGDSTLSGVTGPSEFSASDLLGFADFVAMGRIEAWKDKWGLFFDGAYVDLGADFTVSVPLVTAKVDLDFKQAMLDFGVSYRLLELPMGENGAQKLLFEPLGGLRYVYLKQEVDIKGPLAGVFPGRRLGGSEDWVEPFVGGRIKWVLSETLSLAVRADIGGFGIGSASDLTWNLVAGFDWRFKDSMSLKVGYRIMDTNYERGRGSNKFDMDAQMRGPIFALAMHF